MAICILFYLKQEQMFVEAIDTCCSLWLDIDKKNQIGIMEHLKRCLFFGVAKERSFFCKLNNTEVIIRFIWMSC